MSIRNEELTARATLVMRQEAAAIAAAADRLVFGDLERAVEALLACVGQVIVVGTGKSGIAARKIASTLTSTGTAAIFLHPVDALHGDLGIVRSDDAAIVVSNSGKGEELLAVIAHLRQRDVPVIAIVGDTDSAVARRADIVLDASVEEEACPLDLAPMASTTLAIALGDALAAILMTAKNFTAEEFALNHPAGTLGKRLTLRVANLMHQGAANPTVREDATLMEVLTSITDGGLGATSVIDENAELRGIVTDGDVRRAVQSRGAEGLTTVVARDIMTATPTVVAPSELAYDALRLMEDRPSQIAVLPVVENGRCVGLLRLHDLVQAGLR